MHTRHVPGAGPLFHAALAFASFSLLTACVEDVIITPDPPDDRVDAGPDPVPDATPADPEPVPENPQSIYYDLQDFANLIQPSLDASCTRAPCHQAPGASGQGLSLFPEPLPGSIEMWSNLNALTSYVDLAATPFVLEETQLYQRMGGEHPGAISEPETLEALADWIEAAATRFSAVDDRFDADAFANDIQPMLDASCAYAACHAIETSATGFGLFPEPDPGSPEMNANLRAAAERVDLSLELAEDTLLYVRATDSHLNVVIAQPELLRAWIQDALDSDVGIE
jgi:hypothetical protein